jgi:hypothetical protein
MNLVGPLFELYLRRLDRQLRRAAADPGRFQRRLLRRLVAEAKDTGFGREHGFSGIASHADFARAVPPADYAGRLELYERVMEGEPDVLWPGRVKLFARTSGTTAGQKHIPFTKGSRRNQLSAGMAIMAYAGRAERGLIRHLWAGTIATLTAQPPEALSTGGSAAGITHIGIGLAPWPLRRHMDSASFAASDEPYEPLSRTAQRLAQRDVRFVGHIPIWAILLFTHVCRVRGVDPEGGISRVWPNFRIYCHGGMNFAPYRDRLERFFEPGHRRWYQEVYPATEGFVAIQADLDRPGLELLTDNEIVFEFVPLEEWGKPGARRLLVDEVEPGVPYCLLISTSAGLWAYDIGDVVRFLTVKPPRLVFAGRHLLFLNAFGEHMIGEEVAEAVSEACRATGARLVGFTVAPLYPGPKRESVCHQYAVEFETEPVGGLARFGHEIDERLIHSNRNYAVRRRGRLKIPGPEIVALPPGTFHEWMKRRGKLGGQNKIPICADDRRYIDEILALAEQRAADQIQG